MCRGGVRSGAGTGGFQFRVLGQDPPHPANTHPPSTRGIVAPPAQLLGNLTSPPSHVRLFQRTNRRRDSPVASAGATAAAGRNNHAGSPPRPPHHSGPSCAAPSAPDAATSPKSHTGGVHAVAVRSPHSDRRNLSRTSWYVSTPFAPPRKHCQHRLFICQRPGPRRQTSVPTLWRMNLSAHYR